MIRKYANDKIYKNFRIVRILSAFSFSFSIVFAIAYICIRYIVYTGMPDYQFSLCIFAIFTPLNHFITASQALKTKYTKLRSIAAETRINNDYVNTLVPAILTVCSLSIFNIISCGFLIHNCVLIKREWKNNPPKFVIEQQIEEEREKIERLNSKNLERYKKLIEKCGVKFFINNYEQIKNLPLRDVIITENYSLEEKEERLLAAKKIIDLGLTEIALTEILNQYREFLDEQEINKATTLLSELQTN